jgi:hypothetical protein
MFICSAITVCQEKANCCPHRTPHIKDERCIPKECRYVPKASNPVDCVPYDAQAILAAAEAKLEAQKAAAKDQIVEGMPGMFVSEVDAEKEQGLKEGDGI